jgi:predicted MFS family arabinose efflux permease
LANEPLRPISEAPLGLFDGAFGIAWFLGSALMGLVYDKSIAALVLFSVVLQFAALPMFLFANRQQFT